MLGRKFNLYMVAGILCLGCLPLYAEANLFSPAPAGTDDAGVSLVRLLGALLLVLALFFAGVWAYRNWQRWLPGRAARLKILESRSLGQRHTLHVITYEQQRWLIAVSPSQVNVLGELAPGDEEPEVLPDAAPAKSPFALALQQVLGRKA